jgi:hypothetical protein
MDYYFDLRFCPFWDRDGPFRDRESAVWDRCGPVGARLGPFSTGFGPVSDRLRFQLLGHEIRTAFCIVLTPFSTSGTATKTQPSAIIFSSHSHSPSLPFAGTGFSSGSLLVSRPRQ